MGRWVRDERTLIVVERRVSRNAALAGDGARGRLPCQPIVIRPLDMDEGARAAVVIRDVDGRPVGGDPLAVRLGCVDQLSLAVREVVRSVRVQTCDRGDPEARGRERWVRDRHQRAEMERPRRAEVDIRVLPADPLPDLRVRRTLEDRRLPERRRPHIRLEQPPRQAGEHRGAVRADCHRGLAAPVTLKEDARREAKRP